MKTTFKVGDLIRSDATRTWGPGWFTIRRLFNDPKLGQMAEYCGHGHDGKIMVQDGQLSNPEKFPFKIIVIPTRNEVVAGELYDFIDKRTGFGMGYLRKLVNEGGEMDVNIGPDIERFIRQVRRAPGNIRSRFYIHRVCES